MYPITTKLSNLISPETNQSYNSWLATGIALVCYGKRHRWGSYTALHEDFHDSSLQRSWIEPRVKTLCSYH